MCSVCAVRKRSTMFSLIIKKSTLVKPFLQGCSKTYTRSQPISHALYTRLSIKKEALKKKRNKKLEIENVPRKPISPEIMMNVICKLTCFNQLSLATSSNSLSQSEFVCSIGGAPELPLLLFFIQEVESRSKMDVAQRSFTTSESLLMHRLLVKIENSTHF